MPDEINTDNNGNIQNQPIVNSDQSNNNATANNKGEGTINHQIFNIETEKVSKDLNNDSKLSNEENKIKQNEEEKNNENKNNEKSIENSKKLGFFDVFFLSFGGQAPFISLLTFGTVMISMVGTAGAFAMIVATLVVLSNGLVVYIMSKKFTRGGGYYIYAFYSLSSKLGLETGWNYFLYSLSYGGALLIGGAYVLFVLTGINQALLALIVAIVASSFVIKGIKVSAKYATVMSIIEMIVIVSLSVFFLSASHWHFYDPVSLPPLILVAVIFGLGIPTGYGSIAPLSDDVKNSTKTIGKAAISVLLVGGFMATIFFYSLGALNFTGNIIEFLSIKLGIIGIIFLGFIALNDGTLGGVAYMIANSRTFSAMSQDKKFPNILSLDVNGKPLLSEIFIAFIFVIIITFVTYLFGLYTAFLVFGAIAGLSNLLVHISAGFSLISISIKKLYKHMVEFGVGLTASAISIFVLLFSIPGIDKYIVYAFFGWIILGFLYGEVLDMVNNTDDTKPNK